MPRAGVPEREYMILPQPPQPGRYPGRDTQVLNTNHLGKRRKTPASLPPPRGTGTTPSRQPATGRACGRTTGADLPRHIPLVTLDYHLFILVRVSSARDPRASLPITH
ncbi:hypothetical protein CISG_09955 [Coccidioides immitis RMSCC 3703]|uniref:Uncharacterized protein n=1 Tax=Coccidioides immitis RMSCC 3703 TaxID=454286 RepID=A0A0J8QKH1_COCIT|nr:hypothetical protein CISG_09955 [Coccidioides immitis RMSCC 3703]